MQPPCPAIGGRKGITMTYNDYKAKYGEITSGGKAYALRQDAYPAVGSFDTGDGRYDGNWYEAGAVDADDNKYTIYWTRVNWDDINESQDEGNACDWDNPDYIIAI